MSDTIKKFVKKVFAADSSESTRELKWYQFRQNNSGGRFTQNDSVGTYVLIQARSGEEANDLAEDKAGIYFNGCDDGQDCSCCGDRWYRTSSDDGDKEPLIYDTPVEDYFSSPSNGLRSFFNTTAVVYYFDGTKIVYEEAVEKKEKPTKPAKTKLLKTKIATPKEIKPKVKKLPKSKSL